MTIIHEIAVITFITHISITVFNTVKHCWLPARWRNNLSKSSPKSLLMMFLINLFVDTDTQCYVIVKR